MRCCHGNRSSSEHESSCCHWNMQHPALTSPKLLTLYWWTRSLAVRPRLWALNNRRLDELTAWDRTNRSVSIEFNVGIESNVIIGHNLFVGFRLNSEHIFGFLVQIKWTVYSQYVIICVTMSTAFYVMVVVYMFLLNFHRINSYYLHKLINAMLQIF